MKTGYVSKSISPFFVDEKSTKKHFNMIYGDEVQYVEPVAGAKRVEVRSRSRSGWVSKNDIMDGPVLETYHIDVGQGDSTFIVTPGSKKILIDGGANNQALRFLSWKYRLQDYEEDQRLLIDLVVLSHPDEDHITGLTLLLKDKRIQVTEIIHSGIARFKPNFFSTELGNRTQDEKNLITRHSALAELDDDKLSDVFREWKKAILAKRNVNYHAVEAGDSMAVEPRIGFEILGPRLIQLGDGQEAYLWMEDPAKTRNGNSVIVRMTYGQFSFLYPGDVNEKGSEYILQDHDTRLRLDGHVLKAPHHGSHEYYQPFLARINPQIIVISTGEENKFGHPRANFIGDVGRAARKGSLIFATQITGKFKDKDENLREKLDLSDEEWRKLDSTSLQKLRKQFKRRLHGMINIRTDGEKMFAARRIQTRTGWEYYENMGPSARSIP